MRGFRSLRRQGWARVWGLRLSELWQDLTWHVQTRNQNTHTHTYTHLSPKPYPRPPPKNTHTYIHTHIHTYIHTYIHTDIYIYMYTDIHTQRNHVELPCAVGEAPGETPPSCSVLAISFASGIYNYIHICSF